MKRLFTVIGVVLFCSFITSAETFDIKKYEVDITVRSNGSFDVTENILVHFNEASHGIIRDIPTHYKQEETGTFDKAQRNTGFGYYDIVISNISVKGGEYNVIAENGSTEIRIGSGSQKINGDKLYVVSYTVWGAINRFSGHNEFFWNIIGTDWGCQMNNVSFSVNFAKGVKLTPEDVIGFTGKSGSEEQLTNLSVTASAVTGDFITGLRPFNGITLAVRLPQNYFTSTDIPVEAYAKNFVIRKFSSALTVMPDASVDVEEHYVIDFIRPCKEFIRAFGRPDEFDDSRQDYQDIVFRNVSITDIDAGFSPFVAYFKGFGRNKCIIIKVPDGQFIGTTNFTLRYKAWGALSVNSGVAQLQFDVFPGTFNEPCAQWDFSLHADTYMRSDNGIINFYSGGTQPVFIPIQKEDNGSVFKGSYEKAITGNTRITLKADFKGSAFSENMIPYDIYARNFVISDFNTDLTIEPDGVVKMQHSYLVHFTGSEDQSNIFSTQVRTIFPADLKSYTGISYTLPRWSLMGSVYKPLIMDEQSEGNNMSIQPDWNGFSYNLIWRPEPSRFPDSIFRNEYRIFSILQKRGSGYYLNFPVAGPFEEPAARGHFTIHLPDIKDPLPVTCEAYIQGAGDAVVNLPVEIHGNEITGKLPNGMKAGQTILIKLDLPNAYITENSFLLNLQLLIKNNYFLLLPLLFFFILYVIWYFTGREKKNSLIVQYKPPADVTPAEAGFLWDNKMHRRDLISLIYYWAGHGYLTIHEIKNITGGEKDYELAKIKDLPESAKNFEHTIFSALFLNRPSVRISSLRNNFYCHMIRAHAQLDEYGKFKKFYVPGTRGFGLALRIMAWAELVTGMLVLMNAGYNYGQIFFCFISLFVMLLVFGNIMPKRGHFGAEKYSQLRGFREFIQKAEAEQLRELIGQNPSYFDETVAYAIVLGLGNQWAEKFKPLLTSTPDWYTGQLGTYNTVFFVRSVVNSMHNMDHNLNYHYAQSSRYGYSGTSGFSGHSTFGGSGGSAFHGGGYSGGGFGGGGGRSW